MRLLWIQAVGFLGTVLFFLSYQCRSSQKLFRVQFVLYLYYTVHLLLLGAVTGGISYVLNTVRSLCLSSTSCRQRSRILRTPGRIFNKKGLIERSGENLP